MTEQVLVPDVGEAHDVEVIEILVVVGDSIDKDASLIVLESDKASMEIPSPIAGKVANINVAVGDTVDESLLRIMSPQTIQIPQWIRSPWKIKGPYRTKRF